MICSTGDASALPGMTAIMEAVEADGTAVTEGTWSSLLPLEEQNEHEHLAHGIFDLGNPGLAVSAE